ncbi:hypothetical protein ACF0H5_017076 [Mactra antiquata]
MANVNPLWRRLVLIFIGLQALIQPAYLADKYVWSLYPRFANYDIKNNEYFGQPICMGKGPTHPDLGYDSLRMRGDVLISTTHIDIEVKDERGWGSYSFLTFVYLTDDEGTIFQLKLNNTGNTYQYLGLYYNTSHMYMQTNTLDYQVHATVVSTDAIPRNEWVPVGLVCKNDNEIKLLIGSNITGPVIITELIELWLPGCIRIGCGFLPGNVAAEGAIACLTIYDSDISDSNYASALDRCNVVNWPSSFIEEINLVYAGVTCSGADGKYELVSENSIPDSNKAILSELKTHSRVRCAGWCSRNSACLSFTFQSVTEDCVLYSENETYELKDEPGVDYWVKWELINCC